MANPYLTLFTPEQIRTLSAIVQVGNEAFREIVDQDMALRHRYLRDTRQRMLTKMIQMQSEIESHLPNFPFRFSERTFPGGQVIPELDNGRVILHLARSHAPDMLPYPSRYKVELSTNNKLLERQLVIDDDVPSVPVIRDIHYYALLTFGNLTNPFAVIQFPEPGFSAIAESIPLPLVAGFDADDGAKSFERKKAVLKKEFLAQEKGEGIS